MLDLFVLGNCIYCRKVTDFLEEHGVKYNKIDISDKASEEALIQAGGKRQVPFLIDRDRNIQMYESEDIVEYIKTII